MAVIGHQVDKYRMLFYLKTVTYPLDDTFIFKLIKLLWNISFNDNGKK